MLFFGQMLTATAMGYLEEPIDKAFVFALFIPLIISSGGNSGSQATRLVIRAMALVRVRSADWWRVARREVFSGLMLGGILGAIGFLRIVAGAKFTTATASIRCSSGSRSACRWSASCSGVRCRGHAPAHSQEAWRSTRPTSSAPFVATLVDVTGLVIYYSVAIMVLRGTVLYALHARGAALGERFDFVEPGHRDITGIGRQQRAVRPTEPQGFVRRPASEQAVDQARREAVAAADSVDDVEVARRARRISGR